jgi:hypothetical protein
LELSQRFGLEVGTGLKRDGCEESGGGHHDESHHGGRREVGKLPMGEELHGCLP